MAIANEMKQSDVGLICGTAAILLGLIPPGCAVLGMAFSGPPLEPGSDSAQIAAVLTFGLKAGLVLGPLAIVLSILAIKKQPPVLAGFGICLGIGALIIGTMPK